MAARDHLSNNQFVRLFRGIHQVVPEQLEQNPRDIGPHWSRSPEVAYNFATYRDSEGTPLHDWEDELSSGTIVEALVHKRNIIDPQSEEGQDWASGEAVFGHGHPEQERTVRPGSPVHIQAFHHYDDDKGTSRTVKPTRRKGYRA